MRLLLTAIIVGIIAAFYGLFYLVIKTAVKNGILEAEKQKHSPVKPKYKKLTETFDD